MISSVLIEPPINGHIALLYEHDEDLGHAIAEYINEGLRRKQFCVYATVHYRDEKYLEKFSSLILNYGDNVENGNLLVVDLAPFYISALLGDMKPFEEAKKMFALKAASRENKHVRFVGDGTGFLFKNRHFDECAMIEQWWQEKPFEGSYVCPFSKSLFDSSAPHSMHSSSIIVKNHDDVVNASEEYGKIEHVHGANMTSSYPKGGEHN